jgi:hypothetical protein
LFGQGGDWRKADPEDIEMFKIHGLISSDNVPAMAREPLTPKS